MPDVVYTYLFWALMASAVGMLVWTLTSIPLMFILSKGFMDKYFVKPYFNSGEIVFLSGFPGNLIRNVMFIRLLASPSSGEIRGLAGAYEDVSLGVRTYALYLYRSLQIVLVWMFGTLIIMSFVLFLDSY